VRSVILLKSFRFPSLSLSLSHTHVFFQFCADICVLVIGVLYLFPNGPSDPLVYLSHVIESIPFTSDMRIMIEVSYKAMIVPIVFILSMPLLALFTR
jgi:hypothetical protein